VRGRMSKDVRLFKFDRPALFLEAYHTVPT
jgi:hypothetical protein